MFQKNSYTVRREWDGMENVSTHFHIYEIEHKNILGVQKKLLLLSVNNGGCCKTSFFFLIFLKS